MLLHVYGDEDALPRPGVHRDGQQARQARRELADGSRCCRCSTAATSRSSSTGEQVPRPDHPHRPAELPAPPRAVTPGADSRMRRWTAPLRFAARLLTGRVAPGELRAACVRVLANVPFADGARRRLLLSTRPNPFAPRDPHAHAWPRDLMQPAAPIAGKPDVFVWALIDWHFRIQRPQHLARRMGATRCTACSTCRTNRSTRRRRASRRNCSMRTRACTRCSRLDSTRRAA